MEQFKRILDKKFIKSIEKAGGSVYFVGGSVRDHLLGRNPKDIDLVVTKLPITILSETLADHGKIDLVGESFGILIFTEHSTGEKYEIALPRKDYKGEGRGHKNIEVYSDPFLPIEEDLKRRDFTINSMALSSDLKLIDPFKGKDHIAKRLIQPTSPESFVDDPLRLLRGVQFAARLRFSLSYKCFKLIKNESKLIKDISKERIIEEFKKVFDKGGDVVSFIHQLLETDLFENIFEFKFQGHEHRYDKCKTLGEFLALCLAFRGEDKIDIFKEQFKIDNDTYREIKALKRLSKLNYEVAYDNSLYFKQSLFEVIQIFPPIVNSTFFKNRMWAERFTDGIYPKSFKELPVSGDDLIKLGYVEGREIGQGLKAILDEILSDNLKIHDKQTALKLL